MLRQLPAGVLRGALRALLFAADLDHVSSTSTPRRLPVWPCKSAMMRTQARRMNVDKQFDPTSSVILKNLLVGTLCAAYPHTHTQLKLNRSARQQYEHNPPVQQAPPSAGCPQAANGPHCHQH